MTTYVCYHCAFKMTARRRPKSCPACGKVSHEDQREKFSEVPAWSPSSSDAQSTKGAMAAVRPTSTAAHGVPRIRTTSDLVRRWVRIHLETFSRVADLAMKLYTGLTTDVGLELPKNKT